MPRPSCFTHFIGGWLSPSAVVDGCRKSRPPTGFDPQTFQPVVSRYTDWAILGPCFPFTVNNFLFDYEQKVCCYPTFFSPSLLLNKHTHTVIIIFCLVRSCLAPRNQIDNGGWKQWVPLFLTTLMRLSVKIGLFSAYGHPPVRCLSARWAVLRGGRCCKRS